MIEAGAAGVHFEDQLASEKKCGHMGGKVLVPTSQFIRTLVAARLAADVLRRADPAGGAHRRRQRQADHQRHRRARPPPSSTGERTAEGFFRLRRAGLDVAIARGLAYAPYADLIWCETSHARPRRGPQFAEAHPRAASPTRCWPTTARPRSTGRRSSTTRTIATLPARAGRDGLQVPVRHAGRLPRAQPRHVRAGARVPRGRHGGLRRAAAGASSPPRRDGYTATRHQREVGTGYFDEVATVISGGLSSTTALKDSTEKAQF